MRTLQAHPACDGLFTSPPADEAYTWQTSDAVERFRPVPIDVVPGSIHP